MATKVNQKGGPQLGKYHVNLDDLDSVGVQAINKAVETCNVVIIDEIGPMELFSERFKEATRKALASSKIVFAVVHWKTSDKQLLKLKVEKIAKSLQLQLKTGKSYLKQ